MKNLSLLILVLLLLAGSCNQEDPVSPGKPTVQRRSQTALIDWAAQQLNRSDAEVPFIDSLKSEYGEPLWNFADAFYTTAGTPTVIIPFVKKNIKKVTAVWVITYEEGSLYRGLIDHATLQSLGENDEGKAGFKAYSNMFTAMDAVIFNRGAKVSNPAGGPEERRVCTDWYQITSVGSEITGVKYLDTTCKTEYEWTPIIVVKTPIYDTLPPKSNDAGGGNNSGSGDNDGSSGSWTVSSNQNKICGHYTFKKVGKSWTAEISGLGVTAIHNKTKKSIRADFGTLCISIPTYTIRNSTEASAAMIIAWNTAMDQVLAALNGAGPSATQTFLWSTAKKAFEINLQMAPGSSISTGKCAGNIPISNAEYCD